jgi:hypothetical protein
MVVMQAVSEANYVRQIVAHIRGSYADSKVVLPDDDRERTVSELSEEELERWVRAGINKARVYELTLQSSISAFVALMFDVAPNFDDHRLCEVLLGDEEKQPDERIDEVLSVLSEKNWEAIRRDYDPQAWLAAEQAKAPESEGERSAEEKAPTAAAADASGKTMSGKTMSGKTMSGKTLKGKTMSGKTLSKTISTKSQTITVQPSVSENDPDIDRNTVRTEPKE